MSFNVVFQEKSKANVIIQGKPKMSVSELVHIYYKKVCASKKEKMTKKLYFQGNEISPEEGTLLSELGMKDYSVVEIRLGEQMTTAPYVPPQKKEEPPQQEEPQQIETAQEEPPQEEPPQEEPAQEEQPAEEEQPQEEPPQEEPAQEEQPAEEEQPQEEQPAEEEQPQEEQPAEEEQPQEVQNQQEDDWD